MKRHVHLVTPGAGTSLVTISGWSQRRLPNKPTRSNHAPHDDSALRHSWNARPTHDRTGPSASCPRWFLEPTSTAPRQDHPRRAATITYEAGRAQTVSDGLDSIQPWKLAIQELETGLLIEFVVIGGFVLGHMQEGSTMPAIIRGYGSAVPLVQSDTTLESLTGWLVVATFTLAVATAVLAALQFWGVILQRRELGTVKDQLDLNRQQIDVTREQLRPHLELRDPRWPPPGELPTATVEYVSGSEAASDVCTWFNTQDGRRFGKVPNTPSLSRTTHSVTIEELPAHLEQTWNAYFSGIGKDLVLTGDEWWAAITWQAADKHRYCWIYVQRTDHVEHKEFGLP